VGEIQVSGNSFNFKATEPREFPGGLLFRASKRNFKALKGLAVQGLHLKPGSIREPHSHPNAEQLDYCIEGRARVGIVAPGGESQLLELDTGDISFVPQGHIHWIENIGDSELRFLVVLSHEEPETLELSEALAGIPRNVLEATLGLEGAPLDDLPREAVVIGAAG
jgi:oxalate decarboxylase/phosphoglucose isomerase-like protein (cupin superfamily)